MFEVGLKSWLHFLIVLKLYFTQPVVKNKNKGLLQLKYKKTTLNQKVKHFFKCEDGFILFYLHS